MRRDRRSASIGLTLLTAMALVAASASQGLAYRRPSRIRLLSLGSDGRQGNAFFGDSSRWPILTPDGRYAVFYSSADNLASDDTNERRDVFLRDLRTGEVELLSRDENGVQGNHDSYAKAITPDGRFVTLESWALNWIPNDENGADVWVKDRQTGDIELISVSTSGQHANDYAFGGSISADGRYVTFDSDATNLVPGTDVNGDQSDVFLRDRLLRTTKRISATSGGVQADAFSAYSYITPDGRYVSFTSRATNLAVGDTNGTYDVFVHDTQTGETTLASPAYDGAFGNAFSSGGQISADARFVAFTGEASNLVPHDTNDNWDVFVHDRQTGTTERVSVSSAGVQGNAMSSLSGFSSDGRFVLFQSDATNLVPGDDGTCIDPLGQNVNCRDMFIHDRETGITERLSVSDDGAQANGYSWEPGWVGPGGELAAFMSESNNLVPGDTNAGSDVFLRERGPAIGAWDLSAVSEGQGVRVSGSAGFAGASFVSASDPPGDIHGPVGASAGADLTGVTLTYRPEQEDVLVRLALDQLPGRSLNALGNVGGLPAILYTLRFEVGGSAYELRALPLAKDATTAFEPRIQLFRCTTVCAAVSQLPGGIGTTGEEVRAAVPLASVGLSEGAAISSVEASTGLADPSGSQVQELDQMAVPDSVLPMRRVEVGVAPAGTPGEAVVFDRAASVAGGDFTGMRPGAIPPGDRVWVRACLGSLCGISSVPAPSS